LSCAGGAAFPRPGEADREAEDDGRARLTPGGPGNDTLQHISVHVLAFAFILV